MEDTSLPAQRLVLTVTPQSAWDGDFYISLVPAPERIKPGQPGKKVGDILFVETTAADSERTSHKLLVSLGPGEKVNADAIRRAGGAVAKWLDQHEVPEVGLPTSNLRDTGIEGAVSAFCEGLLLGAFRFERHKTKIEEQVITAVHLLAEGDDAGLKEVVAHTSAIAAGVNLAREWSHEPPNVINPVTLAARASDLAAENGMQCTILGENELIEIGAGAILSVGLGSKTPSQMIVLEYAGDGPGLGTPPVILVGKALTFDTGGYSLKSTTGIVGMKYDKCGGMTVLGVMQAAAALKLSVPLVGILGAAENMISSDAYRPNDIITTLSGKTVEIISTDAEGRMVLSDALTYAHTHYQPRVIIDLATLTGGVVVALGNVRAGLMTNDESLGEALMAAGERTHERLWRLPLDEDYFELIKGDDSDLKNSSGKRQAHSIVGGIFLKQFVPDEVPWAHIDMAGLATVEEDMPYNPKGATGFGVRLLMDYLKRI